MPRDGNNVFTPAVDWEEDAANGVPFSPARWNEQDEDFAEALNDLPVASIVPRVVAAGTSAASVNPGSIMFDDGVIYIRADYAPIWVDFSSPGITDASLFILAVDAALTGTPTAPTPSTSDDSTRIATTAFVAAKIAESGVGVPSGGSDGQILERWAAASGGTRWASKREVLTGPRTYYVATTGNDANTGLSAGTPFLTIQKAVDVAFATLDVNGFDVTISIAAGTYAAGVSAQSPQVGAGRVILSGDTTTPANVTVSSGGATSIYVKGAGTKLFVQGIKVTNAAFAGWHADAGGLIQATGKNEIGAVGGHQIIADGTGIVFMTVPMVISGGCAGAHLLANNNGFICTQGGSWTITGTPTVGQFASAGQGGVIYTFANSFTGAINGQRYSASLNGVIQTNTGGNVNYFPGTVAGAVATGGQYA